MQPVLCSLLAGSVTASISLSALVFRSVSPERLRVWAPILASFSAGILLSDALLHLLPESLHALSPQQAFLFALGGFAIFLMLDLTLRSWSPRHGNTAMLIVGDGVHNFLDGVLIGLSFSVDTTTGIIVTSAIIAHELPQELGDFGALMQSEGDVQRVIRWNILVSLTVIPGVLMAPLIQQAGLAGVIPITAGSLIYVAAVNILPSVKSGSRPLQAAMAFLAGIFTLHALEWIPHVHVDHLIQEVLK
jgi:zinc and cadmium transporter